MGRRNIPETQKTLGARRLPGEHGLSLPIKETGLVLGPGYERGRDTFNHGQKYARQPDMEESLLQARELTA